MDSNILVINPGSTSDDIGFYSGSKPVFEVKLEYSTKDMAPYVNKNVTEMAPMKTKLILSYLNKHNIDLKSIDVVMGRGGLSKPTEGGIFYVNDAMLEDLRKGYLGVHPCNLGGILAKAIADEAGCPALISDPEVVDEMYPVAKYTGMPGLTRVPIFHALSQRRAGYHTALKLGKKYEDCRFVIMHGGGGITIGLHIGGKVVDVTSGVDGEGPMTPQRSGTLPTGDFMRLCYSGKYTLPEMSLKIRGKGGLYSYCGTHDLKAILSFIETGDKGQSNITCSRQQAKQAVDAMIYQIAKYIAYIAAPAEGKLDGVIFTGAIMYGNYIRENLVKKTSWLAPVFVYPGSDEKSALKEAALRALENPSIIKEYK